jgi:outer membrane receptor protein involved in Fe transport
MDNNGDGFIDQPTYRQLNAFQIWKQPRTDGTLTEVSAQVVDENRNGGQMEMPADPNAHHALPRYTLGLHTQRAEASFRTGHRLNEDKEWQTVAVFASGAFHRLTGNFGARAYEGEQRFGWVRAMYKTIVGNTLHVLTMGPSFMYDEYSERFDSLQLNRSELVPGAYAEYNGQLSDKLSIVAGLRADVHNLFGLLVTPRVHLKYDIAQRLNLRVGGGRGLHTPNVLVENLNVLTSSRRILMRSPLKPEDAWNVGVSAVWHVRLGKMPAYWAADYYRTQFARQQVVDLDAMPGFAFVYNHEGTSFSNAAQTEVYVEPLEWLNFKAAYKFYDVRARYAGRLQQRPLVPKHRVMLTATLDRPRWMLNATALWVGPQRLPSTSQLPTEHQRPDWSPSYVRIIAQATYRLGDRKQWEVYIGGENLTNYVVRNALIAPEDPFGPYFDTSMAWGPVMGAMGYAGFRWKLE